jgi:hypothetical protein
MDPAVVALALGAAAGFGPSLVLTQIGLRHLSPLRGSCVSLPTTALAYLALAPAFLDSSGFHTGSALLFAPAGCFFPAAADGRAACRIDMVGHWAEMAAEAG